MSEFEYLLQLAETREPTVSSTGWNLTQEQIDAWVDYFFGEEQ